MRLVPGDTPIFPRRICVTPPAPPSNDTAPSPPNTAKSLHAPILSEDKDESTSQLGVDNPVSVVLGEALALPLPLADAKGVPVLVPLLAKEPLSRTDVDGLPLLMEDKAGEVVGVPGGVVDPDADSVGDFEVLRVAEVAVPVGKILALADVELPGLVLMLAKEGLPVNK